MKYALFAIFLSTGDEYRVATDLDIYQCAGRAAMERMAYQYVVGSGVDVGDMRMECRPQPIANQHTERLRWRERE